MIDPDDLVSAGDVARLFGWGGSTVSNWQRRHKEFPAPVATVSNGTVRLFSRRAVIAWYRERMSPELIAELRKDD